MGAALQIVTRAHAWGSGMTSDSSRAGEFNAFSKASTAWLRRIERGLAGPWRARYVSSLDERCRDPCCADRQ